MLTFSSTYSQEVGILEYERIDNLITLNDFEQVKSKLAKLEQTKDLSIINLHKIYDYKIRVAQLEKHDEEEISLMKMYVLDTNFDSVFIKNKRYQRFHPRNDTFRVYLNKSSFSRQLAKIYQAKKDYKQALEFLTLHETKYLFPHPCGTGHRSDEFERQIISGKIHQNLGNHKMVFKKLLPLTFRYINRDKKRIDSILMTSLNLVYTKREIHDEFRRCIKSIPDEEPASYLGSGTEINIFDINFIIHSVKRLQNQEERKRNIYKIKDNEKREKIRKEIYRETYKSILNTNRIYKLVS